MAVTTMIVEPLERFNQNCLLARRSKMCAPRSGVHGAPRSTPSRPGVATNLIACTPTPEPPLIGAHFIAGPGSNETAVPPSSPGRLFSVVANHAPNANPGSNSQIRAGSLPGLRFHRASPTGVQCIVLEDHGRYVMQVVPERVRYF